MRRGKYLQFALEAIRMSGRNMYGGTSLLCNLVGLNCSISSLKSFEAKLLHVCLSGGVVNYGIVVRIFALRLPQSVSLH